MCEPISATTLTYIAIASAVAGGAVAADAQIKAGAYQAQVANNQAKMVTDAALVEEQRKREETAQMISLQRAKYGAAGIDPNFGSAADLQMSTAMLGELDALTIRTNAKNESAGLIATGQVAKSLGRTQALSTALSTASQVAGQWGSFQQAGGGGGTTGAGAGIRNPTTGR